MIGYASSWSEEVMQTMMVNTVDQWVNEVTRRRGKELLQLDLVFTEKPEMGPGIKYLRPMGKIIM